MTFSSNGTWSTSTGYSGTFTNKNGIITMSNMPGANYIYDGTYLWGGFKLTKVTDSETITKVKGATLADDGD